MLQYMLDNDINNWIHYYAYTFIIPVAKGEENEAVNDLSELYAFVLTGYILDTFREKRIDIKNLVEGQVLAHKTNQYDLTVVDGVEFKRDYKKYAEQMKASWILNGGIEEEWDSYLQKMEDYGLSEYLEIKQKYFDAYIESLSEEN